MADTRCYLSFALSADLDRSRLVCGLACCKWNQCVSPFSAEVAGAGVMGAPGSRMWWCQLGVISPWYTLSNVIRILLKDLINFTNTDFRFQI